MKLSKINLLLVSLGLGGALFLPNAIYAQAPLPDLLPACTETGACRICDIIGIFITLGRWLIAGAALLALLVIVYAGSQLVISQGSAERVGAAKKQIVGAVVGLGLVLVAFQFVTFIIFAVTTPASQQNPGTAQTADGNNPTQQNLGSFLTVSGAGMPWWKICDQAELLEQGSKNGGKGAPIPSTGSCAYWGDATICSKDGAKKCCKGLCTPEACKTEEEIASVVQGKPKLESPGQDISDCDLNTERGVRQCLKTKGGIDINKDPCANILTSTNCTSVIGLSPTTVQKLITASGKCNFSCIYITGGTEQGPHVSHGGPNVVDVRNNEEARSVLEQVGLNYSSKFLRGQTNWFVCDEGGRISSCSLAGHLHIVF